MSTPFSVKKGIYIDLDCTAIIPVAQGIFIPTGYRDSEKEQKFQKDLAAFLNKWFSESEEGAKDYSLATGCRILSMPLLRSNAPQATCHCDPDRA